VLRELGVAAAPPTGTTAPVPPQGGPPGDHPGGAAADTPDRVLVVEDDPLVAGLLAGLLGEDHEVTVSHSGEAGLAAARSAPGPDLILLDVTMDGMDGYEVCGQLKASPATRDIPVIFLTGRANAEDERRGLELGAADYIHKPFARDVVRARVRNQIQIKRNAEALTRLTLVDPLTGLPNRRRLDAYLDACWAAQREARGWVALAMIDVDHFKAYNDRHGHAAGDDCLRRVAAALDSACAGRPGLMGRYGGEEFLWVLTGADPAAAEAAVRAALDSVRALALPHGAASAGAFITLSIGVAAVRPADGVEAAACLAEADRRLYRAKAQGRDRVVGGDAAAAAHAGDRPAS
jgi:diguanylate cyclase (GGDEF)-like protein